MLDRDTEIDGLIEEHRQMMTIMSALRHARADPGADIDTLLDQLEATLARHTAREETGLFRILRSVDVPGEYVGLFEHDHGHVVDLLASARHDRQQVDVLVATLEAHMQREEGDMFPAAEQLLGPSDWDVIEAAVAHLP
jgi:hemerythrin-like domain-containing protein